MPLKICKEGRNRLIAKLNDPVVEEDIRLLVGSGDRERYHPIIKNSGIATVIDKGINVKSIEIGDKFIVAAFYLAASSFKFEDNWYVEIDELGICAIIEEPKKLGVIVPVLPKTVGVL